MMAAKHKELELMAGLLQMREQQIEDLRALLESSQLEVLQLQQDAHARGPPGAAPPQQLAASFEPPPRRELVASFEPPPPPQPAPAVGPASEEDEGADAARMRREVQRLRLRVEDLEAHVAQDAKAEHVKALEQQVTVLRSKLSSAELDESGLQQEPLAAAPRPRLAPQFSFSSLQQPNGSSAAPPCSAGDEGRPHAGFPPRREAGPGRPVAPPPVLRSESMPTLEALPKGYSWGQRYVLPDDRAAPSPYRHAQSVGDGASSIGELQTYRSAVRVDRRDPDWQRDRREPGGLGGRVRVAMPEEALFPPGPLPQQAGWDDSVSEGAETGGRRQSKDLLSEMRRLRLQMSELERVAGSPAGHASKQHPQRAATEPRAVWGHAGGEGAALNGSALSSHAAAGPSGAFRARDGLDFDERTSPAKSTLSDDRSHVDYAGWQYRAHAGDPLDAAIAALVNRPGRYSGWRAMLCRLDQGLYLCGTRRVRLRVDDDAREQIKASGDDGRSWMDLGDLMNGAEGSQHALLERVRSAVRSR